MKDVSWTISGQLKLMIVSAVAVVLLLVVVGFITESSIVRDITTIDSTATDAGDKIKQAAA